MRKGEREHAKALPPEGERKRGATPQDNPNEGDHEPSWLPREPSREDVLSTWEALGPWDPGGKSPSKTFPSRKGLLRPWTPPQASLPATRKIWPCKSQVSQTALATKQHWQQNNHAPGPYPHLPVLSSRRPPGYEARTEGAASSCKVQRQKNRNAAVWWPSHWRHTQSRASRTAHSPHTRFGPAGQFNARPQPLNTPLARPHFFVRRHFAAVRRLSAK